MLYVIRLISGVGRVPFCRLNMYFATCILYKSCSLINLRFLNKSFVCSLYLAPEIMRIAFFCIMNIVNVRYMT